MRPTREQYLNRLYAAARCRALTKKELAQVDRMEGWLKAKREKAQAKP